MNENKRDDERESRLALVSRLIVDVFQVIGIQYLVLLIVALGVGVALFLGGL